MKEFLFAVLALASGIIASFAIPAISCLWIVKLDGKTFYESVLSIEYILRFLAFVITISILFLLYARFVFCPLIYKAFYD